MRILILGGTVFLSREIARQALERGHEVTCVSRGDGIPDGATHTVVGAHRRDGTGRLPTRALTRLRHKPATAPSILGAAAVKWRSRGA